MKDIAKDVGVSAITVSKALRNHPDISVGTRERIVRRARELNYQLDFSARALVTGKTFAIGLIVPDLVHPFFGEVAKGLTDALREKGFDLLIACSEEDCAAENGAIGKMLARRVDALILASVQREASGLHCIAEREIPCILIDRYVPGSGTNFVGTDDEMAGELATEHLISAGCRRIAHIRGPLVSTAEGRERGYRNAMRKHGIPVQDGYIVMEETGDKAADISGQRAMASLLSAGTRPDGVFCYNDPSAMGAMHGIFNAGFEVPGDIAVIGCGNVRYSQFLRVPLSSVDQKSSEIGRRAGSLALELIASETEQEPIGVRFEPSVVARASTWRHGSRNSRPAL
jgi:LacI family transcriptional regulator